MYFYNNRFQQKDTNQYKKTAQPQKISTLSQTDEMLGSRNPSTEQKAQPGVTENNPGVANPFMYQPMNACGHMPTPFFIPGNYFAVNMFYGGFLVPFCPIGSCYVLLDTLFCRSIVSNS